jgi:hypothetical protein
MKPTVDEVCTGGLDPKESGSSFRGGDPIVGGAQPHVRKSFPRLRRLYHCLADHSADKPFTSV